MWVGFSNTVQGRVTWWMIFARNNQIRSFELNLVEERIHLIHHSSKRGHKDKQIVGSLSPFPTPRYCFVKCTSLWRLIGEPFASMASCRKRSYRILREKISDRFFSAVYRKAVHLILGNLEFKCRRLRKR